MMLPLPMQYIFSEFDLPPLFQESVHEVHHTVKASSPLVFTTALSAAALAIQGLYDVEKPNGQQVPASLMCMVIAGSGERKSTVENIYFNPFKAFQREQLDLNNQKRKEWALRQLAWGRAQNILLKSIEKSVSTGEGGEEATQRLLDHGHLQPVEPRPFHMLLDDTTTEKLLLRLHLGLPSAGLISSEAIKILKGPVLRDMAKPNALWSGDAIAVDRVTAESFRLEGARLGILLMVQDEGFDQYMKQQGELSRGTGLWARFLVCRPYSMIGTRFLGHVQAVLEKQKKFDARVEELLQQNLVLLEQPRYTKSVIRFSSSACARWIEIFNAIEQATQIGGYYHLAGDHASKLADNIARVAAIFHVFEGREGEISLEILESAIKVCMWFSGEFMRIFVPPPPLPQVQQDANELNQWLWEFRRSGLRYIKKTTLRQRCPSNLRKNGRFSDALMQLVQCGNVAMCSCQQTMFVDLHPHLLPDQFAWQNVISVLFFK